MFIHKFLKINIALCFIFFTIYTAKSSPIKKISETKVPISKKSIVKSYPKDFAKIDTKKNKFAIYKEIIQLFFNNSVQMSDGFHVTCDSLLLPEHIRLANRKHEGLNLTLIKSPDSLLIDIMKKTGTHSTPNRYIVEVPTVDSRWYLEVPTAGPSHYLGIDVHFINNQASVIALESTSESLGNMVSVVKDALSTLETTFAENPEIKFLPVFVGVHHSNSECLIHPIQLLKAAHKATAEMANLHKQNLSGVISESGDIEHVLPIQLMKYQQLVRAIDTPLSTCSDRSRKDELNQLKKACEEKESGVIIHASAGPIYAKRSRAIEYKRVQLVSQMDPEEDPFTHQETPDLSPASHEQKMTEYLQHAIARGFHGPEELP